MIHGRPGLRLIDIKETAPHHCHSTCPGDVNRRKLEAFDGLLAKLKGMMHHHDHDQIGWPQDKCMACVPAFAAIAGAEAAE